MSTYSIIGCGQTAKDWIPRGHSIGVNDAWKWGKPTDSLLCCNRPTNFNQDRLRVITGSKPKTFYSHKAYWSYAFPEYEKLNIVCWYGTLYRPQVYFANTSPFIAMSLAFHLGAKEIILWGVDLKDHNIWHEDNPETKKEVGRYMELIREMELQGCKVYLGAKGTAFDELIPIWIEDHLERAKCLAAEKLLRDTNI